MWKMEYVSTKCYKKSRLPWAPTGEQESKLTKQLASSQELRILDEHQVITPKNSNY